MQYDEKDASKTRTKSNKWSLCGVALNSEERLDLVLGELCADHTHSAGDVSRSGAYLVLLGNKVEMVPNAVSACNDALSAEYCAVFLAGQLGQGVLKLFPGELLRSLNAEVGEYLVGVVTVVMVVMSASPTEPRLGTRGVMPWLRKSR